MKRVIVVGGSAGAISAFCSVLKAIPRNFPAPILAVIHLGKESSTLATTLQRCSALEVIDPQTPEPIHEGCVYVAAPNRHLIVKSGCATAVMGPRENRHRPSVDALFRSAARAYREAVIAVVLSGALDDGSAGALAVKSRGGIVVVQEPADAQVPDMPNNVLRQVKTDHCVKLKQIPSVLQRLIASKGYPALRKAKAGNCENPEMELLSPKEPVAYTCPDCGGALLQITEGKNTQLRCHVGHRYSLASFTEAQAEAVERAVWVALRKLKERQTINETLAHDSATSSDVKKRFKEYASAAANDIKLLEEVLTRL